MNCSVAEFDGVLSLSIYDLRRVFGLPPLQVGEDFVEIPMMFLGVFLAVSPYFFDDFIVIHSRFPRIKVPEEAKDQDKQQ
jgi:hypothetical protein